MVNTMSAETNPPPQNEFTVKPWNNNNPRSLIVKIGNTLNKFRDPENYIEITEERLNFILGKNADFSKIFHQIITRDNQVVGFFRLVRPTGFFKTWKIMWALYPEYLESSAIEIMVENALKVAQKSDVPEIYMCTYNVGEYLIEKEFKKRGINPLQYLFHMDLTNFERIFPIKEPQGYPYQLHDKITDFNRYLLIFNKCYKGQTDVEDQSYDSLKNNIEWQQNIAECQYYFVYDNDVEIASVLLGNWSNKESGYISRLMVLPEYQKKGIGIFLLKKALQKLHEKGAKHVYLTVFSINEKAIDLYKKCGFHVDKHKTVKYFKIK